MSTTICFFVATSKMTGRSTSTHVPRLRVLHRRVLRLELVLGRGFDEADVAAEAGRDLVDGNLRRVGRPYQRVGIVVVAFGSVRAEERDLALAGLADRDVVVVDDGFELFVGGLLRLGAVDVEDRPDGPGESAAAASPSAAPSRSRGRPAGVGLERAAPHRRSARPSRRRAAAGAAARASRRERELDRAVVVDERERGERKRDGGVLPARCGRDAGSKPRVIEGRFLHSRLGVDQHELVASADRAAVPEPVRPRDPGGLLGHVDGEALIGIAQRHRPLVVGQRALRRGGAPAPARRSARRPARSEEVSS